MRSQHRPTEVLQLCHPHRCAAWRGRAQSCNVPTACWMSPPITVRIALLMILLLIIITIYESSVPFYGPSIDLQIIPSIHR